MLPFFFSKKYLAFLSDICGSKSQGTWVKCFNWMGKFQKFIQRMSMTIVCVCVQIELYLQKWKVGQLARVCQPLS